MLNFQLGDWLRIFLSVKNANFENAINLIPTWNLTNQIIFDYLNDKFDTPIEKTKASLFSIHH
jgi:hypothetical protein